MSPRIRLHLLATLATEAALLALGILTGALAARWLQPGGRGALAAILLWPHLIAALGFVGLGEATAYRISTSPSRYGVISSSSFWLAILLTGICCLVGYLFIPVLLGDARSSLSFLARLYLVMLIPSNFATLCLLGADQGSIRLGRYNLLRLLVPLIYLSGLITLRLTHRVSLAGIVVANGISTVLVALVRVALQWKEIRIRPSLEEMRTVLKIGLPFHATGMLLLLSSQADQYAVLLLLDNTSMGIYAAGLSIASSGLAVVGGAFHKVLFPHIAQAPDSDTQNHLLSKGLRTSAAALLVLSGILFILMPRLVPLLFGPSFASAIGPARALLVAYLFVGLKTVAIHSFRGFGASWPGTVSAAISLVVLGILVVPLARLWHLVGIAASLGLANAAALLYLFVHLHRERRVTFTDVWRSVPATFSEITGALTGTSWIPRS